MRVKNLKSIPVVLLLPLLVGFYIITIAQSKKNQDMASLNNEETQIRALEDSFVAAFNTGEIDAIMKNYVPDQSFIIFDVVPRKEYRGADAYRKFWEEMFSHFKVTPKIEIADLGITVDGNVGFGHSFQHVTGTDKQGKSVDRWVRVTDGYRKVGGHWLIAMEHISVPVDFRTGKLVPITGP